MAFIGAPSPAKSSILTTIEPNRRQYLGDGEQTVFAIDYYENFVLVFQNGIKLTENLDYEISQDGKHVRFIVAPEMNDTIDLYGTIDIANTENRTIYSNTSFTTFTSLTDVDTLSAADNQVLTTDANGYFYFRDTTLNELTDVNPTVNFAQYLTGDANGYFFANTEFKNLVDLNPSVSPAQYLTGDANGFFFANTRMRNLEDLNTAISSNQYLTGNANGYFFANTEFKNLVDVNPTANNGQILVADGSGNFSFQNLTTSTLAENDIDANTSDIIIKGDRVFQYTANNGVLATDRAFQVLQIYGTELKSSDLWTGASFYGTDVGQVYTHGSWRTSLVSNGYRHKDGTWHSYELNGNLGAALIEADPAGYIFFRTRDSAPTGSDLATPYRMTITSQGNVSIGGTTTPAQRLNVKGDFFHETENKSNKGIHVKVGQFGTDNTLPWYNLFTRGNSSAQSSGIVEVWTHYGTPSSTCGYRRYGLKGSKGIDVFESYGGATNGYSTLSIRFSGETLQLHTNGIYVGLVVKVTIVNNGQPWNHTWHF